jgi:hypothetical protein
MNITTVKGNYTVKSTDRVIVCDSSSVLTLTLKSAVGNRELYYIKNIGSANVTISAAGGDVIDGSTTATLVQYDSANLLDYRTNYWIKL